MVLACQQVGRWNGFSTSFHRNNNDLGSSLDRMRKSCSRRHVSLKRSTRIQVALMPATHRKSEEPSTCAGVSMRTTVSSSSNSLLLLEDPRARERALQILRHPLHFGHRSGKTLVCIVYRGCSSSQPFRSYFDPAVAYCLAYGPMPSRLRAYMLS